MTWTDGSIYKGYWIRGIQNGQGVMTYPDGTILDGLFEANIFKGENAKLGKQKLNDTTELSSSRPLSPFSLLRETA
jgi:hypothetical protein